jgi:pimeloyl-ACP methyl ester carboxylesterase
MTTTRNSRVHRLLGTLLATLAVTLSPAAPAQTVAQELPGTLDATCNCYRSLAYGPDVWTKVYKDGRTETLNQAFNLYPGVGEGPRPVIVWAHPGGSPYDMLPGTSIYNQVVAPAVAAGFSVVSVEFRHPVSDDHLGVYHRDIADAVQYVRQHAERLNVQPHNAFLMGRSRGSLVTWTAMQDDMADPLNADPVRRQSTRVNAVFVFNGQTTYSTTEQTNEFMVEADRAEYLRRKPDNPAWGSALQSVTPDDPPIRQTHQFPFFRRLVEREEFGVHHPDFGLALCDRYIAAGIGDRCSAVDNVPKNRALEGFPEFFAQYLKPAPGTSARRTTR